MFTGGFLCVGVHLEEHRVRYTSLIVYPHELLKPRRISYGTKERYHRSRLRTDTRPHTYSVVCSNLFRQGRFAFRHNFT